MAKQNKKIALICMMIIFSGVILSIYITWWVPNQKMRDLQWWENASAGEMRKVSHQVLRYPVGNHHDAFLALEKIGNSASVPLLIRALKWHDSSGEDDFVTCTTDHCLSALRSLTGTDKGTSFAAWNEWWKNTGSKTPLENFYPRVSTQTPRTHP